VEKGRPPGKKGEAKRRKNITRSAYEPDRNSKPEKENARFSFIRERRQADRRRD